MYILCFPSGTNTLENIPASDRANSKIAVELHFPKQKKLFFLDWAKFENVAFIASFTWNGCLKKVEEENEQLADLSN